MKKQNRRKNKFLAGMVGLTVLAMAVTACGRTGVDVIASGEVESSVEVPESVQPSTEGMETETEIEVEVESEGKSETEESKPETETEKLETEKLESEKPETEKLGIETEKLETEKSGAEKLKTGTEKPETGELVQKTGAEQKENTPATVPDAGSKAGEEKVTEAYTYADVNKTMYAQNAVNVRDLPSTSGNKLGALRKNQEVTVTGQCNETGWYRIVYGENEAFVSGKYLGDAKAPETAAGPSGDTGSSDFLTADGYLNPNNPVVAAAMAQYGENIGISEDGIVFDLSTWEAVGRIENMPGTSNTESGTFDRAAAEEVWSYMNEERVSAGLNALEWDENIYNFACQRAQQIVTDFSHNGCGNYGENIQYQGGTTPNGLSIHTIWFLSPGHHENYMRDIYGSGACAVYVYNGMTYAVQNFALASGSGSSGGDTEPDYSKNQYREVNGKMEDLSGAQAEAFDNGNYWTASNGLVVYIESSGVLSCNADYDSAMAAINEYDETH